MTGFDKFDISRVVAPMLNQSDAPYRALCFKYGATCCYTEMLHANRIVEESHYLDEMIPSIDHDCFPGYRTRPLVVQICGNDPHTLAAACRCIRVCGRADAVDLNLGCPQDTAKAGFFGSYLLDIQHWPLVFQCVAAMNDALGNSKCDDNDNIPPLPLFCKIRICDGREEPIDKNNHASHYQESEMNESCSVEKVTPPQRLLQSDTQFHRTSKFCQQLYQHGAAVVCIHGRTRGSVKVRRGGAAKIHLINKICRQLHEQHTSKDVALINLDPVSDIVSLSALSTTSSGQPSSEPTNIPSNKPSSKPIGLPSGQLDVNSSCPSVSLTTMNGVGSTTGGLPGQTGKYHCIDDKKTQYPMLVNGNMYGPSDVDTAISVCPLCIGVMCAEGVLRDPAIFSRTVIQADPIGMDGNRVSTQSDSGVDVGDVMVTAADSTGVSSASVLLAAAQSRVCSVDGTDVSATFARGDSSSLSISVSSSPADSFLHKDLYQGTTAKDKGVKEVGGDDATPQCSLQATACLSATIDRASLFLEYCDLAAEYYRAGGFVVPTVGATTDVRTKCDGGAVNHDDSSHAYNRMIVTAKQHLNWMLEKSGHGAKTRYYYIGDFSKHSALQQTLKAANSLEELMSIAIRCLVGVAEARCFEDTLVYGTHTSMSVHDTTMSLC